MNLKKALPLILLVVLAAITLFIKQCNTSTTADVKSSKEEVQTKEDVKPPSPVVVPKTDTTQVKKEERGFRPRGLNRHPAHINYSKHARCRMDCRHITEDEVEDILRTGKINYAKSDIKPKECSKKYAVEGYTKDNQHVRMIFSPCSEEVTVVTVIDLDKEWVCDCE